MRADAEAIVEIVGAARAEVVAAYEIAREPQVWIVIGKMSIETVKDTVDGRARLDELPAYGICSVADVLRAGQERLVLVPGIGEGTARNTIHAAEQLKRAARDSLQFRIEFDPRNPELTRLVRALASWGAVWRAAGTHETHAGRLVDELATELPIAARAAAGPLRRLFMRGGERTVADDAARRVQEVSDAAESSGLPRAANEVREVRMPGDREVWHDFEQHSADYPRPAVPRPALAGTAPRWWRPCPGLDTIPDARRICQTVDAATLTLRVSSSPCTCPVPPGRVFPD